MIRIKRKSSSYCPVTSHKNPHGLMISIPLSACSKIDPSVSNVCAVIAVADQESNFSAEANVPGLPKIA